MNELALGGGTPVVVLGDEAGGVDLQVWSGQRERLM